MSVFEAVWRSMAFTVLIISAAEWRARGRWGFTVLCVLYALGMAWETIREVEKDGLYWSVRERVASKETER